MSTVASNGIANTGSTLTSYVHLLEVAVIVMLREAARGAVTKARRVATSKLASR